MVNQEIQKIMKINYKSDFDFILRLTTINGVAVGFPTYDWRAYLYPAGNKTNKFVVSSIGGELRNCFNDNGEIHVVANNHKLSAGILMCELFAEIPNGIYPDGDRLEVTPFATDIELVKDAGDEFTQAEIEAVMPYVKGEKGDSGERGEPGDKGDPFTFADFTPQQIAELQRPATEAAESLSALENSVQTAEVARKSSERDRVSAEAQRAATFSSRISVIDGKQDKLSTTDDLTISSEGKLSLTDMAKKRLFIDMWNNRAESFGRYNEDTGYFELNEITDIGYEEALNIFNDSFPRSVGSMAQCFYNHSYPRGRTLFSPKGFGIDDLNNLYAYCRSLVSIRVRGGYSDDWIKVKSFKNTFLSCNALEKILGEIRIETTTTQYAFQWCEKLRTVHLTLTSNANISFADSPLLESESFRFLVDNATNSAAITITVHPNVYAKLTDEDNTEWHQILLDAIDKNISFATV